MPHTKQHIQFLLNQVNSHPHHKWGQNFLIDLNLMQLVVDSIDINKNDLVLEVGHGTGSMTELLSDAAGKVIAVDIDPDMHTIARQELADRDNVQFIHTDILAKKSEISPEVMSAVRSAKENISGRFLLVANLPYNVASPLMINLLTETPALDGMCVTVQEEVADRMCAGPADGGVYGKISVVLQATGKVAKVRTLKPGSFWPAPKVNSAIVSWQANYALGNADIESLKSAADILLGKRRKQIQSCLPKDVNKQNIVERFQAAGIDPQLRAEKLSVDQFIIASKILA